MKKDFKTRIKDPKTPEDMIVNLSIIFKDKMKDLDKHKNRQLNIRKSNSKGKKQKKDDE